MSKTKFGTSNLPVSILIERQLPNWVAVDHPMFLRFLEAYYEWLESEGQAYQTKYCLKDNLDVDSAVDDFLDFYKQEYLDKIPESLFSVDRCEEATFPAEAGVNIYDIDLPVTDLSDITVWINLNGPFPSFDEVSPDLYEIKPLTDCGVSGNQLVFDDSIVFTGVEDIKIEVCDQAEVNERLLIKIIKQFNITKGTEASYRFLFRLLFNEEIEIFYPNQNILKPSDGKWDGSYAATSKFISFNVENPAQRTYNTGLSIDIDSQTMSVNLNGTPLEPNQYYLSESLLGGTATVEFTIDSSVALSFGDTLQFNYSITEITGDFINEDGKLSSIMVLQDGLKYQQFSYVIKSERTIDQYGSILKKLLHPAGLVMFGEIQLKNCIAWLVKEACYYVNIPPVGIESSNADGLSPALGPRWSSFDCWKFRLGLSSMGENNSQMQNFENITTEQIDDNPNKKINFLPDAYQSVGNTLTNFILDVTSGDFVDGDEITVTSQLGGTYTGTIDVLYTLGTLYIFRFVNEVENSLASFVITGDTVANNTQAGTADIVVPNLETFTTVGGETQLVLTDTTFTEFDSISVFHSVDGLLIEGVQFDRTPNDTIDFIGGYAASAGTMIVQVVKEDI